MNDSPSSGERTGKRPNRPERKPGRGRGAVKCAVTKRRASGTGWEAGPEGVRAPYAKRDARLTVPEYRRTRETRWEAGGSTLQA